MLNNLATQALIEGMGRGVTLIDGDIVDAVCRNQPFLDTAPSGPAASSAR